MRIDKKGLLGISPLVFFLAFFLGTALLCGEISKVSITISFLFAAIYAVAITKGLNLPDRVRVFARGAGTGKMMFMIIIFVVAGAFAKSAEAMGCIDATVNIILSFLPPKLIFVSLFITGCLISMATGSGIGSIVALCPIAIGICQTIDGNPALFCAIVVCSAMFGDNLSFISDTTIIATSTQGCKMSDKFKVNLWIALPAAIVTIIIYYYLGRGAGSVDVEHTAQNIKILPYILVIVLSVCGCDVLITLLTGALICGIMGMSMGEFNFIGWTSAMEAGVNGMGSLIIVVILAAGTMALITHNGGLDFIVSICTKFVKSRKSAEGCIALLTALICVCTSNNTIAIVSVSSIVKEISEKYGVDPRKAASLMDTSSCIALELLPYSTHTMVAATFAGISAASAIPYMFYAFMLALFLIVSIVFDLPRLRKA